MKFNFVFCLTLISCTPNLIYLNIKADRDPDFKFFKTQSIKVVTQVNPTVSENISRKKVEDWLAFKNFKLEENKPNYVLLILQHEYESKDQILTIIPNFFESKVQSGNSEATVTALQNSSVTTEERKIFKSLNLHLYRSKDLEKYFNEKSSVNPTWEATCSTEINDMEDYERKIINTCMKSFPKSFKGQMKLIK